MDGLKAYRYSLRRQIAKSNAMRANTPVFTSAQRAMLDKHSEFVALPAVACAAIQDVDPSSPTFGQLLFNLGAIGLGRAPLGG